MEKFDTPMRGISGMPPQRRCVLRSASQAILLSLLLAGCGGGDDNGGGSPSPGPDPADTTAPSVPQAVAATAQSATEILVSGRLRPMRAPAWPAIVCFEMAARLRSPRSPHAIFRHRARTGHPVYVCGAGLRSRHARERVGGLDLGGDDDAPGTGRGISVTTERVFSSLPNFANPVAMLQAPADASGWYVVEQAGRVRDFDDQPGVTTTRVFMDIRPRVNSGGEWGLLGMAFHPASRQILAFTCRTRMTQRTGLPHLRVQLPTVGERSTQRANCRAYDRATCVEPQRR